MKFVISYAYDVPHYADFCIDARNKKEALEKARNAFRRGRFRDVRGQPDDTVMGERVFFNRVAHKYDDALDSIEAESKSMVLDKP